MGLSLVLAIVSLVLSIIAGWLSRTSTPSWLLAVAVALLAAIHIIGGGGLFINQRIGAVEMLRMTGFA